MSVNNAMGKTYSLLGKSKQLNLAKAGVSDLLPQADLKSEESLTYATPAGGSFSDALFPQWKAVCAEWGPL